MERSPLVTLSRLFHVLLAVVVLVAGLLGASVLARTAHADIVASRSDPVVSLSNGMILDLSATIQDGDTDIQHVSYTLHIPSGVSVLSVVSTDGPLGLKETFAADADDASDTYDVTTVVSTLTSHIAVTATTAVVSPQTTSSTSASGWDNAPLHVEVVSS